MNFFKKLFGKEENKDNQQPVVVQGSAPEKAPLRLADAKDWNVGEIIHVCTHRIVLHITATHQADIYLRLL